MEADDFKAVRARTIALAADLSPEDCQVQSMPDASPVKWHLAHTTWFFETFVLKAQFRQEFGYLFNSYYNSVGPMAKRPERGLVTRPTLAEIYEYRSWVDERVSRLLESGAGDEVRGLVEVGIHHEQQHQELLLTDIKHAFSLNPTLPAYRATPDLPAAPAAALEFIAHPGGIVEIGAEPDGFAYDNERPRHKVLLQDFLIADRPTTNAEYRAFIRAGGYEDPSLWLSDAWALVQSEGWRRPLYWSEDLDHAFTLAGVQPLDPNAPVCHLSHYEADAFARWSGARLPTEFEWEAAAPSATGAVWEWTASAYLPYPGFRPAPGNVGEYNGKFMSGQMVLRGGSAATAPGHSRVTYRNFFPPSARWQFSGVRLARDA
jgi:ergothioneine biosynthesis protein EgtB